MLGSPPIRPPPPDLPQRKTRSGSWAPRGLSAGSLFLLSTVHLDLLLTVLEGQLGAGRSSWCPLEALIGPTSSALHPPRLL